MSYLKIINGHVFYKNLRFETRDIYANDGIICNSADGEVFDADGCYVLPGLIDIHMHGCINADASSGDIAQLEQMSGFLSDNGVTGFCPTTMTLPIDKLERAFCAADEYKRTGTRGAKLLGVNMEGPYFSMEKKGAQNPDYIKNPDITEFDRLWNASNGIIRITDIAPEKRWCYPIYRTCQQAHYCKYCPYICFLSRSESGSRSGRFKYYSSVQCDDTIHPS